MVATVIVVLSEGPNSSKEPSLLVMILELLLSYTLFRMSSVLNKNAILLLYPQVLSFLLISLTWKGKVHMWFMYV